MFKLGQVVNVYGIPCKVIEVNSIDKDCLRVRSLKGRKTMLTRTEEILEMPQPFSIV